jgi:hypothetical protein
MADRLQAELAQTKLELQHLKERMDIGAVTVHKDLSLVSLIPKWPGADSTISLEDFFSSIESSAKIANWKQSDQLQIAVLKLCGGAKMFYQGWAELHTQGTNWETFKEAFRSRYKDVHADQYHFTRLQTARQKKNESPQEFADRCRDLAQKITRKVDDSVAQRVHCENAERMLLASFVSGLIGAVGRQTKYAAPSSMHQALQIALAVEQAEKQEKFNESFYTRFEKSVCLTSVPE